VTVVDVLKSESFLQGLFLLIATAGLTGLLLPTIKARVDDRKLRDQRVFEANLARQGKVIEAQAVLLDTLAEVFWSFLLLALAVVYYAYHEEGKKAAAAWARYDEEAWTYFGKVRVEISNARRLTRADLHGELLEINSFFMGFDSQLMAAIRAGLPLGPAWGELHGRISGEGASMVDDVLRRIAEDLRLVETTAPAGTASVG
jgi:cbb3-type cytochrome oxidase subunit 3